MKISLSRIVVVGFLSPVLFSSLPITIDPPAGFYNTIFVVIGIFYSIGCSVALSFDYSRIGNKEFALKIRNATKHVLYRCTIVFVLAALVFITTILKIIALSYQKGVFKFSLSIFAVVVLVYILAYMVFNFFRLQRLKDDLDDKIRSDSQKSRK